MAGAFTHLIICDEAKRKRESLDSSLYQLLNKHSQFLFLGACSPDLPYLSFKTGEVNWADVMHYESTNSIAKSGHGALKKLWPFKNIADEIKLIWLMGFVSHLVADASIHPIVQAIVGPYEENKEEHRLCEMTQDCLVFNKHKNNDIYYAEFSSALKFCGKSDHFHELMVFWQSQIANDYHDKNEKAHPGVWFETYTEAIDAAEGGSSVVAIFRHLGIAQGYLYKTKAEITSKYFEYYRKYYSEVKLPNETIGSFEKDGFNRTVDNVISAWKQLYSGLNADILVADVLKNWNLDTGVDMDSTNKEATYWVA
jgi:hypothetical protein